MTAYWNFIILMFFSVFVAAEVFSGDISFAEVVPLYFAGIIGWNVGWHTHVLTMSKRDKYKTSPIQLFIEKNTAGILFAVIAINLFS